MTATSPTVLASSSSVPAASPAPAPAPVPATAKFPVVLLIIAVAVGATAATLGVGGLLYYLARSGRLPLKSGASPKIEPTVPVVTHAIVLEPLLVNLADAGGSSYLRLSLVLQVVDANSPKEAKPEAEKTKSDEGKSDAVAAVRDTALTVLGQQTAEGLLAPDGKKILKEELKAAFAKHNPELKVTDLFFTDFLVQR
jgi:flagellar protein FliL